MYRPAQLTTHGLATSLLMLLLASAPSGDALADVSYADGASACQQLLPQKKLGERAYAQQRYAAALAAFKQQAALSDYCAFNADESPVAVSERQRVIAYNNVGLSYAKLGKPLWALAWYQIAPTSRESQYNRAQLTPIKRNTAIGGIYVKYASQGAWSRIEIKPINHHYNLTWVGLNMKANGLIMGPNLGNLSLDAAKTQQVWRYTSGNCQIDFHLNGYTPLGQRRILVQSKGNLDDCGFGHGVVAQGEYVQVEDF